MPPAPKRKAVGDTDTQQNAIALAKAGRGDEAATMLQRLLLRTSDPKEIMVPAAKTNVRSTRCCN